jgi:dihydroxy-acid dehydratase
MMYSVYKLSPTRSNRGGLRRRLASYGDEDFSLFLRTAFVKAMGYSDDALSRPIVGITNTFSDFNPCHGGVPRLIDAIRRGVLLAGGLPLEFPTMSLHESFAHPTSMYLRNLMALETEELLRAQPMDAVVLIGGCDKTIPAQLMAAVSADVPAIVVPVGPMLVGHHRGRVVGACTDCRSMWAEFRAGRIDADEIAQVSGRLAPTPGTCMVMGTASTMACATEAMGLTLPGGGSIPAPHADRLRLAEAAGARAVALADGPIPSALLTGSSLRNAQVLIHGLGGSTNALVHLAALAGRLGLPFDLDEFDRIGREVPVLVDLKPTGEHYMEDFHWAGGVPRLLRELEPWLDLSAPTVLGGTIGDYAASAELVPGQSVIRSREDPVSPHGAIAVLRGNLAPRGAVIKHSAASPELLVHSGRAVVFESAEDLAARIDADDLDVAAGDVLLLRNVGPVGGPGMPEVGQIRIPKKLARSGVKDMVRISDARMSGTGFGTTVLHVTPEAAVGGPLALVRNGDRIRLDVPNRRLDLLVDDAELAERRASLPAASPDLSARGYRRLFLEEILQADAGCDFAFCLPVSPSTETTHE